MGLEAETPVFARISAPSRKRHLDIDELWPSIRSGSWPPGFSMSRAQIYDTQGRLTGVPQDVHGEDR